MTQQKTPDILSIFYDGNCPLCLAEIHVLKNNNHQQLLKFVNLHDEETMDKTINCELALQVIHAKLSNGQVVIGSKVFEAAYQRSDLAVMKALFSFKPFQSLYSIFYITFARFRHQVSKLIGPTLLTLAKKKYPDA